MIRFLSVFGIMGIFVFGDFKKIKLNKNIFSYGFFKNNYKKI
jgi:hypothetical protein